MSPVKIIRYIALLVAIIGAFIVIPYAMLILVLLGAALGFMGVAKDERVLYLVAAVALAQVAGVFGVIPTVGVFITDILTNFSAVFNGGAAAVILTIIKERVMD